VRGRSDRSIAGGLARPAARILVSVLVLACAVLPHPPVDAQKTRADHVVLVSIDGFRPEFYLDARWPAPTLQRMIREGAHARLVRPGFPSVTFPSHTTIITGASPARNGVFYNTPFEPAGQTGRWYWETSSIRVPTLWHAVRAAGLKSASVKWPVSVGGPIDYDVPDIWSLEAGVGTVAMIRQKAQPSGRLEEVELHAIGTLRDANFTSGHLTS
jgi:predicted AlkP superfamily pyrophosphatase or phosphodiesterase